MENEPTSVEELFYKLKEYGETTLDLYKLKGINKVSGFTSTLIVSIILIMLLFVMIICISIGVALLIGEGLGHAYWGFFIVTGIYIIIGLVLLLGRNKILKKPIADKLLKELID